MKPLPRPLKALMYVIAGFFLLLAALLAWLVAVNWRDAPLSEAAKQALSKPPLTEAQLQGNGYLTFLGLDAPAPEGRDTASLIQSANQLARERLACVDKIRMQRESAPATAEPTEEQTNGSACKAPSGLIPEASVRLPQHLTCPKDNLNCFAWYHEHRAALQAFIESQHPQLQRLAAAGQAQQFDSAPAIWLYTPSNPVPQPYVHAVSAHQLWLIQAALQWMSNDPQAALSSVQNAARFRQRLAESSQSLAESMIALAMHYRELQWLSQATTHAQPNTPAAVLASMDALLAQVPTFGSTWQGELRTVAQHANTFSEPRLPFRPDTWLYLPHETLNLMADRWQAMNAMSRLPVPDMLKAASQNQSDAVAQAQAIFSKPWRYARNFYGHISAAMGMYAYLPYFHRLTDVEGYRRLVVLQRLAQQHHIAADEMPQWLKSSPPELRDPYTEQPMQWDANTQSLVFEGKERQSQHADRSSTYRVHLRFKPD